MAIYRNSARSEPDVVLPELAMLEGLRASPKKSSPIFLYDEFGAALFDRITELEEYYPTRMEKRILAERRHEIARLIGPESVLAEYGPGSGEKARILLDALESPVAYLPIDIAWKQLLENADVSRRLFPEVRIVPVHGDFRAEADISRALQQFRVDSGGGITALFLGSTIGNFDPPDAIALLEGVARAVGRGGRLLIGYDRLKDPDVLERAYNDSAGVTAAFNLNLLSRFNRELDAEFDPGSFFHRALFNPRERRIEMHLVSTRSQYIRVGQERIFFRTGESIHTENSYKYSIEDMTRLARSAGFSSVCHWSDPQDYFTLQYLKI